MVSSYESLKTWILSATTIYSLITCLQHQRINNNNEHILIV